jgi:hypothetical protein
MPFRSAQLTLANCTQFTMKQLRHNECHGGLTDGNSFPDTIEPGKRATWEHESQGINTGTEGWVKFRMVGAGDTVLIYWDNPAVGNTFFGFAISSKDSLDPNALFGTASCGDDQLPPSGGFEPPASQFAFFALSEGILDGKIVGVIEHDTDDPGAVILPFPGQDRLFAHASFEIGVFDKQHTSLRICAAVLNTAASIRALTSNGQLSFRQRLTLPFGALAR